MTDPVIQITSRQTDRRQRVVGELVQPEDQFEISLPEALMRECIYTCKDVNLSGRELVVVSIDVFELITRELPAAHGLLIVKSGSEGRWNIACSTVLYGPPAAPEEGTSGTVEVNLGFDHYKTLQRIAERMSFEDGSKVDLNTTLNEGISMTSFLLPLLKKDPSITVRLTDYGPIESPDVVAISREIQDEIRQIYLRYASKGGESLMAEECDSSDRWDEQSGGGSLPPAPRRFC